MVQVRARKRKADVINDGQTKSRNVDQSVNEYKKRKTSNNRSAKVVRNKASRKVRLQHSAEAQVAESSTVTQGRRRNLGNIVGDVVKKHFKVVTLNIGTINPCLRRGLMNNYDAASDDIYDFIRSTIPGMTKINTDLIRCGAMATFDFINTVMESHPSIDLPPDIESRRRKLRHIEDDKSPFFTILVKRLFSEDRIVRGEAQESTKVAEEAVASFKKTMGMKLDELLCRIRNYVKGGVASHFLEQIALTLADMIRCHIKAFVSELKLRVSR